MVGASAPRLAAGQLSRRVLLARDTPNANSGNTLILTHTDRMQPKVADVMLGDDRLIEVSSKGEIVWDWVASDHIDELGFCRGCAERH